MDKESDQIVNKRDRGGDRWFVSAVATEDALQGNLREFPLGVLLQMLANKNRTGALTLQDGSEIWLSEGLTYLSTSANGSSVSAVLYGAEAGSLDEIEAMFNAEGQQGTVVDQILEGKPELEPVLRRLLHEYTLNSLFEMLVPSDATFRFEPNRRHRLGDRFAHDTGVLVSQAEQRLEIWRRIAARIPSTAAIFKMSTSLPDNGYERVITADEWRYLSRVNGHKTVADVITETGESAFRVCSTLYRLLIEELIVELDHA